MKNELVAAGYETSSNHPQQAALNVCYVLKYFDLVSCGSSCCVLDGQETNSKAFYKAHKPSLNLNGN